MAKLVLVDVGNTRLKWCVVRANSQWSSSTLLEEGSQVTSLLSDLHLANLVKAWQRLDATCMVIGSVASPQTTECLIHQWNEQTRGVTIRPQVNQSSILHTAYENPQGLGVDRWLACLGATSLYPNSLIMVVSAGTATTIDFVTPSQSLPVDINANAYEHRGGAILPGVQTMQDSLSIKGALLPQVDELSFESWPVNTKQAIGKGVASAQLGAIALHVEQAQSQFPDTLINLCFTGGWGLALSAAQPLSEFVRVSHHAHLVMVGLFQAWLEGAHGH